MPLRPKSKEVNCHSLISGAPLIKRDVGGKYCVNKTYTTEVSSDGGRTELKEPLNALAATILLRRSIFEAAPPGILNEPRPFCRAMSLLDRMAGGLCGVDVVSGGLELLGA